MKTKKTTKKVIKVKAHKRKLNKKEDKEYERVKLLKELEHIHFTQPMLNYR